MSDPKDILMNNDGNLPEDKLLAYLEGRLSATEQHEVEQWLAEEGMESDALDGLQTLPAGEAKHSTDRLNYELHKTLAGKKHKRRQIKDNPWSWLAVGLILLLIMFAYIIIHMVLKK